MKKAIVLLANGCEEVEAITQIDFLRRGNVEVAAASIHDTTTIQGAHGITIMADCLLKDLAADSYDMVVLPGGGVGMQNLKASAPVAALLKSFAAAGKWVCAICASPSVLGGLGLVQGKKYTCYPGFEPEMTGGQATGANVVVDGNIITSKGPGTSIDFALQMIEVLNGKELADKTASDAQYIR